MSEYDFDDLDSLHAANAIPFQKDDLKSGSGHILG